MPNVKDEPRARTHKPWMASYGAGLSAEGVFESLAVKLVGSGVWFGGAGLPRHAKYHDR